MPPKAKKDGKKAAGAEDSIDYNDALRQNYRKACTTLGLTPHPTLLKAINNDEDPTAPLLEICTDSEIGSAGVRAFCAALLARGAAMKPTPYKPLKSLRLWRAAADDAGVAAVAEVLRNGRDEVSLTSVECMDCGVGPVGCLALGESLMLGANASLETLRLDLNAGIGDAGVVQLCKGLRTNRTLKKLTLAYCGVGVEGAEALAEVIVSPLSVLEHLDVMGNHLGSEGLAILARAAASSKSLRELVLRDNGIGGGTIVTFVADRPAALRRLATAAALGPLSPVPGVGGGSAAAAPAAGSGLPASLSSPLAAAGGAGAGAGATSSLSLLGPTAPPSAVAGAGAGAAAGAAGAGGALWSLGSAASPAAAASAAVLAGLPIPAGGAASAPASAAAAAGGRGGMGLAVDPLSSMAAVDAALADAATNATAHTKAALEELGRALASPTAPLCHVNLEMNALNGEEAAVLVPYLKDNAKVQVLRVDTTLPTDIFAALCRTGVTAKKKKKAVAKKKK